MQASDHITPIQTTAPNVFGFRVTGQVDRASMDAMAKFMNIQFDTHDSVNILVHLDGYDGTDFGASFDWDVIKANFRSNTKVDRYAVVGAPDGADDMIAFFDKLSPVEAKSFAAEEMLDAWSFVGAQPVQAA